MCFLMVILSFSFADIALIIHNTACCTCTQCRDELLNRNHFHAYGLLLFTRSAYVLSYCLAVMTVYRRSQLFNISFYVRKNEPETIWLLALFRIILFM